MIIEISSFVLAGSIILMFQKSYFPFLLGLIGFTFSLVFGFLILGVCIEVDTSESLVKDYSIHKGAHHFILDTPSSVSSINDPKAIRYIAEGENINVFKVSKLNSYGYEISSEYLIRKIR